MKKAVKIFLIAALSIAVLTGAFCLWWYNGVDLEKRYKALFDRTFAGNYTMTVTDSGTYAAEGGKIRLPSKYKDYEITYFDKDGNERRFEISSRMGLGGSLRNMLSTALNRGRYLDLNLISALENESSKIFLDQVRKSLKAYYGKGLKNDSGYLLSLLRLNRGDGYQIELMSQNYNYMFLYEETYMDIVFPKECRERISRAVSPKTCTVLSEQDIRSYAGNKNAYLGVVVTLRNKKCIKKSKKFMEETEALMSDFTELSDFGGNFYYRIFKDKDPEDDIPVKTLFEKQIVLGSEIETDGGNDDYSNALKEALKQQV